MRKIILFVLGFAFSFGIVHVALGGSGSGSGSGSGVTDAGVVDAGSAATVPAGSAAAPTPLPDPIANPGAALSTAETDVHVYGPLWGGLAVLVGIVAVLAKRNDEDHWIHNPYALGALVLVPALGGGLLSMHFGGSLQGFIATVLAAVAVVWQKPAPAAK